MTGSMIILLGPKVTSEHITEMIRNFTSLPDKQLLILLEPTSVSWIKDSAPIESLTQVLEKRLLESPMIDCKNLLLKLDSPSDLCLKTSPRKLTTLEHWRDGELPHKQNYLKLRNQKSQ